MGISLMYITENFDARPVALTPVDPWRSPDLHYRRRPELSSTASVSSVSLLLPLCYHSRLSDRDWEIRSIYA